MTSGRFASCPLSLVPCPLPQFFARIVFMCGRFTVISTKEKIRKKFNIQKSSLGNFVPRYNIAPSSEIPVIRDDPKETGKTLDAFRWGFMPHWIKPEMSLKPMINARAETLAEKPSFRDAFKRNRCLIVADGFYEWKRENNQKTPMYIHLKSNELFVFAGIWSEIKLAGQQPVFTAGIITTQANDLMRPIHDRMPVILEGDAMDLWLDSKISDTAQLTHLLKPIDSSVLEAYPVSSIVNSPANDTKECVKKI